MKAYYNFSFLAIIMLLIPFRSLAVSMGDIMGQVTDVETHKPVAFAKVILENSFDKVVVTANEYGYYYASHVPEGRYQIRVYYNNRTFFMNRVEVYDSYANEVNFLVSRNDTLPTVVMETTPDPLIRAFEPHDILITSGEMNQASVSMSDVLMAEPGIDIYRGHLYVKGAQVKVFIDGTPVLAPVLFNK